MSDLKQREGEAATEWLARLRQLDPQALTEHQRFFLLQHALDAARVAVKREEDDAKYALATRGPETPPDAGKGAPAREAAERQDAAEVAFELCKTAYRALGREGRVRFALWMSQEGK